MKLLEKILVPVNFEDKYDSQLELAANLAQRFNSGLLLLHVLPDEAKSGAVKELVLRAVNAEFEKLTEKVQRENISLKTELRYGNTFDQIMTVSEDENVNLILIGNEENAANSQFKISVLAEKLTRKSEKPVWVHRTDSAIIPANILCPVDFSDASHRALKNALKVARIFNSKLHILNVYEPAESFYSPRIRVSPAKIDRKKEKENKKLFDEFLADFNFSDVKYKVELLKGEAYVVISNYIKENDIGLLLMGATGKSMLSRILLGNLTEQIVRDLPCSLITTKSENILNLKIDSDISNIERHFKNAIELEEKGFFEEAAQQFNICLRINDLHIPSMTNLVRLYKKMGKKDLADNYSKKLDEIFKRLWDKKIEIEIRKHYKF